MSIYNNIKLTAPPQRLNNGSSVPSLDSGSLEQVTTMAPLMGSFRGILRNRAGDFYIPFKITPPRSTSTIAGPPSYPYNTLHVKGIVLKEQSDFVDAGGTVTTGFECWTAITNPYSGNTNLLLTDENVMFFPTVGYNNIHPNPVNVTFSENSPIQTVQAFWNVNNIVFGLQVNSNLESNEPFFIKGQYLLL